MLLFLENAKKKLEDISVSDQRIAVLDEQLEVSKQRLIELSENLTRTRMNAAKVFEKKVCDILQYLNITVDENVLRTLAHMLEFMGLSVLLFNATYATWEKKITPIIAFTGTVLYAITDEIHQIFQYDQNCD